MITWAEYEYSTCGGCGHRYFTDDGSCCEFCGSELCPFCPPHECTGMEEAA